MVGSTRESHELKNKNAKNKNAININGVESSYIEQQQSARQTKVKIGRHVPTAPASI